MPDNRMLYCMILFKSKSKYMNTVVPGGTVSDLDKGSDVNQVQRLSDRAPKKFF